MQENKICEQYFTALFDNLTVGVSIIDPEYKIIKVNRQIGRMFHRDPEDFKGKYCFVECERRDRVCAHCPGTLVMNGNPAAQVETKGIRLDGSSFSANIWAVPMYGKDGKCTGFIELVEDITERKKVEDDLRSSNVRFKELFDNMSSGVAVYEARDEGQDFVFKDINKSGERYSKVKREQIIGRSVSDIFPGVAELGLLDVFRQVWKTGNPRKHPVAFYHDEHVSQWVENYVYKLPSGEIVAVYDDVTGRKKIEEELQNRLRELEVFYEASVGREERILELKNEIERLKKKI